MTPTRLPPIPPLDVRDGLLWTEAVEINVAWHCNIRCLSCSHGSPAMPHTFADPTRVFDNLSALATWMRTDHVRLVGGEPLLHPDLLSIVDAVHASGLTTKSRIITNGLALPSQPRQFWDRIAEVHISIYPNTKRFHQRNRHSFAAQAAATDTELVYKTFDHFRKSFRPVSEDDALTEAIYRTCQIANRWRCLTVEDGHLYRCPQSALPLQGMATAREMDRLTIATVMSQAQLRDWITNPAPLEACRGCAGSVGQLHPHRQLNHRESSSDIGDIGDIGDIDHHYLTVLSAEPDAPNGCVAIEETVG